MVEVPVAGAAEQHGAIQPELGHRTLELSRGGLWVRCSERGDALEGVRAIAHGIG